PRRAGRGGGAPGRPPAPAGHRRGDRRRPAPGGAGADPPGRGARAARVAHPPPAPLPLAAPGALRRRLPPPARRGRGTGCRSDAAGRARRDVAEPAVHHGGVTRTDDGNVSYTVRLTLSGPGS